MQINVRNKFDFKIQKEEKEDPSMYKKAEFTNAIAASHI
jgi:hypothetical protein